ncbi:MAG TPA: tetratricopeptide repeat protein [Thiothrix sp.]|nr:tetratricopeptide repeat protein [Thiothrix sp.]
MIDKHNHIAQAFPKSVPQLIAQDQQLGLMLFNDHQGIPYNNLCGLQQKKKALKHYVRLQKEEIAQNKLQKKLPSLALETIYEDFLAFLNPAKEKNNSYRSLLCGFINDENAHYYYAYFSDRKTLFDSLLQQARVLPQSLNHGDLHVHNLAEKENGDIIFLDWDDAVYGHIGLSLYFLLGNSSDIYHLLNHKLAETASNNQTDSQYEQHVLLNYYQSLLQAELNISPTRLEKALPASLLMGTLYAIQHYGHYPISDQAYQTRITPLLLERLEELIGLGEQLSIQDRQSLLYYANTYLTQEEPIKAINLYQRYLAINPHDLQIYAFLAEVFMQIGDWHQAAKHYAFLHARVPENKPEFPQLCCQFAEALLKDQQIEKALQQFETVLLMAIPSESTVYQSAMMGMNKASYLLHCRDRAKIPHLAPSIQLSDEECLNSTVHIEQLQLAHKLFDEYGLLVVENLFPRSLIEEISALFFEKYQHYLNEETCEDSLELGDKRRMITVAIEAAFADERLYGHEFLTGFMRYFLDEDYVLGGVNVAASLPQAAEQDLHKDYKPLFGNRALNEQVTPSFAISLLIPLIDLRPEHGVTRFIKQSHRVPEQKPDHLPMQTPIMKMGDAVIFDYRTAHYGLCNRSTAVRPLLCMIYHRSWFRDALNYQQQKDIQISAQQKSAMPDKVKPLFRWVNC